MGRLNMMKHWGVKPYLVFDGDYLPSKANTEALRARRRDESKKLGLELLKAGKRSGAHLELQKAIDITPQMARNLIDELKKAGVTYVVAPYEADAEMVYLERQGLVQGIISEDSDLLVFGAKRLLTKLDQYGNCIEINRRDFCRCREVSFAGWTDDDFRHMAILSGCDYLEGVAKMGLKTAYRMLRKHKSPERLIRMLKFDEKFKFPDDYITKFTQADLTFKYQRVFCPTRREMALLTEPKTYINVETMPFIGAPIQPDLACSIADGDTNPITKEPMCVRNSGTPTQMALPHKGANPKDKPIHSFFHPDRIPLGAMAPNSFPVCSHAVNDLTSNGQVSRVYPMTRPYLPEAYKVPYRVSSSTRRQSEQVQNTTTTVEPRVNNARYSITPTTVVSSPTPSAMRPSATRSSPRPKKKARLCNEDDHSAGESSKFFLQVKNKQKSRHTGDFPISPEAVYEAPAGLPDSDNSSREEAMSSTIAIFDDTSVSRGASSSRSTSPKRRRSEAMSSVAETPVKSMRQQFVETTMNSETPPATFPSVSTTRSYSASIWSQSPVTANTASTHQTTPRSGLAVVGSSQSSIPSPLQRIHARAVVSNRVVSTSNPSRVVGGRRLQRTSLGPRVDINPSLIPLPQVDTAEVLALNSDGDENSTSNSASRAKIAILGSEDLMSPEQDLKEDESAGSSMRDRFDFSRFMCT